MKRHTFEETLKLDEALQQLSAYDITGGMMIMTDSPDSTIEIHKKIADRFNYYKRLIQNGSVTFDSIKNKILSHNGPYLRAKLNTVDEILEDIEEIELEEECHRSDGSLSEHLLEAFLRESGLDENNAE